MKNLLEPCLLECLNKVNRTLKTHVPEHFSICRHGMPELCRWCFCNDIDGQKDPFAIGSTDLSLRLCLPCWVIGSRMVLINSSDTTRLPRRARMAFSPIANGREAGAARVGWVDVGKGMSILLVVFFHAHLYLAAVGLSHDGFRLFNWVFNPVRMPLFFAISGALAAVAVQGSWSSLMSRKIYYFLTLFAVWSSVHTLLFKYVLWHPNGDFDSNVALALLEGLVRPQTGIWFIWALVFFFLITKSLRHVPVLAVTISLAAGLFGKTDMLVGWGFSYTQQSLLMYLPFFVIPALYGWRFLNWAAERPCQLLIVGALLGVLSKLLPDLLGWETDGAFFGFLRPMGGLCFGIGLAVFLSRIKRVSVALSYFGHNTLPIYLMHVLALSGVTTLVSVSEIPYFAFYGVPLISVMAVGLSLLLAKAFRLMGAYWLLNPAPQVPSGESAT